MGVPLVGLADFNKKFAQLKHKRDLFAFLLYDERPSQRVVGNFAREHFKWLDHLAGASNIYFFMFLRPERAQDKFENCSLKLARDFDIEPKQLPGIVLFTLAPDKKGFNNAVYLPLKTEMFNDIKLTEEVLSNLFSIIQRCLQNSDKSSEWIEELKDDVNALHRRQRMRPVLEYLKEGLFEVVKFPKGLIEAMSKAFAEGAAKRIVG